MWKPVVLVAALVMSGLPSIVAAQAPAATATSDSLLAASAPAAPAAGAGAPVSNEAVGTGEWTPMEKHFNRAAFETFAINGVIWAFDRYIREGGTNTGFRIGINSWHENLLNGFEWDDNQFSTNQLAHPYHGSMYFAAARSSGFDYWQSMPFAFAGSAMWEYFGETHHPSINDWVSTSVGGASVGEMLTRLSEKVLDNQASGSGRTWREVGGLLINPMGGINRFIDGDWSRVGPNPPSRQFPFTSGLRVGARLTGEGNLKTNDSTRVFFRLRGAFGSPTSSEVRKPYDGFTVDLQFNANDVKFLGRGQVIGVLRSWEVDRGERSATFVGAVHMWDYINTWAYKLGAQSLGGAVFHTQKRESWSLNSGLIANWIILGGTSTDYTSYTGRSYDYGPGVGARGFVFWRHRIVRLSAESDLYYLRILNGTRAHHLVAESRFTGSVPVKGPYALGAEYSLYNAERHYESSSLPPGADPDVSKRNPQLTIYLAYNH